MRVICIKTPEEELHDNGVLMRPLSYPGDDNNDESQCGNESLQSRYGLHYSDNGNNNSILFEPITQADPVPGPNG